MFYAKFEDFITAFIGPFASVAECDEHAAFCKKRGDSSTYFGAVTELPEGDGYLRLTSNQDRFDFEFAGMENTGEQV